MSIDDFISALERAQNIEFSVVLRRPEEIEVILKENEALKAENEALRARLENTSCLMTENLGLRSRLKSARKVLNSHGISSSFLDR